MRGKGCSTGVRVRVGGCQALESGPGGSLGASRVFTNEGSKKEKKGAGRTGLREELDSYSPQQGDARIGESVYPEKR